MIDAVLSKFLILESRMSGPDAILSALDFEGWFFCESRLTAPWGLALPGGRPAAGLSGLLYAGPVDIYWPTKRSPKMTANWTRASFPSRGARFQSAAACQSAAA